MKKNKSSHFAIWLIIAFIAVISYIAFVQYAKNGINIKKNLKNVTTYESIQDMVDESSMNISIPDYILSLNEELTIQSISEQLYDIHGTTFALKICPFIDVGVDPLGLYEESNIDKSYNVSNSDITYIRIRQEYSEYPNCTIINWCTNKVSYGLLLEDKLTDDNIFEILNINNKNIKIIDNTKENKNTNTGESKEFKIGDKFIVKLPEFSTDVTYAEKDDEYIIMTGDTILFSIIKSNQAKDYNKYCYTDINNEYAIKYSINNIYSNESESYYDYEKLLSTIDDIYSTIIVCND